MPTVKPLDTEAVLQAARKRGASSLQRKQLSLARWEVRSPRLLRRTIRSRSRFSVFQSLHRRARLASCSIASACPPKA